MDVIEKLQKRITKKEREMDDKRQEHDREMAAGHAYIEGVKEAIAAIKSNEAKPDSSAATIKAGSNPAKAYDALKAHGHPMHIGDLLAGMRVTDTPKARANVSRSLRQIISSKRVFTQPDANTFGLMEWDDPDPDLERADRVLQSLKESQAVGDADMQH